MAYSFASDNAAPVHPKIMAAISACNEGFVPPYGTDELSRRLNQAYSDVFEHDTYVFPVASGTAANGLALGSVTPPHGVVLCHELSHIVLSEAGAVEFFSGGCRLVQLPGQDARLSAQTLTSALSGYGPSQLHQMQAAAISLTQATDRGTVYTLEQLRELAGVARAAGLKLHMDGARFANALVHVDASPADMTWKSGVDIVSFGTTKNGTMMAEAVLCFDKTTAEVVRHRHKRAGSLHSKMRYFAAQLLAYIENDLWLDNARAANRTAQWIAERLEATPGIALAHPVEANQIFAHIADGPRSALKTAGLELRSWGSAGSDLCRLVTSYCDPEDLCARLMSALDAAPNKA